MRLLVVLLLVSIGAKIIMSNYTTSKVIIKIFTTSLIIRASISSVELLVVLLV